MCNFPVLHERGYGVFIVMRGHKVDADHFR